MSTFVELHLIQNFPPHCLNRDDTNTPKDCEFGGFRRARISSQCLKRSMRLAPVFEETVATGLGVRTKLMHERLVNLLKEEGKQEDQAEKAAAVFVTLLLSAMDGEKTKVLLYLGYDEVERMKNLVLENWDKLLDAAEKEAAAEEGKKKKKKDPAVEALKKELKKGYTPGTRAADIALFGRMMAEHPDMNINAASQVAHAISTHPVSMEMDFYTAVDDLNPKEETGAGMMGVTGYNSSCFYRYALVDVDKLTENLGGDKELAKKTVEGFLRSAVAAIPTGKQNSMAAHTPPDTILAVVRQNGAPVSLANAFEKPVHPSRKQSLVAGSTQKMDEYLGLLKTMYGMNGEAAMAVCTTQPGSLSVLKDSLKGNFAEVVETVLSHIG
ncbi:MAG: type I-E CRISPR-associated protein Cas7/Cse4/CasC [Deltaproteobacteria bacterium]|nr:type I-E CRISPR-associated protein Cas7/Cse4/CasC [Deltaproteobacteria bacterium]